MSVLSKLVHVFYYNNRIKLKWRLKMKTEVREIKKIKVWSVAKVFLVIGLIVGFFYGISLFIGAQQTLSAYPDMATMSFADASKNLDLSTYSSQQIAQMYLGFIFIKLGYWNILLMPIALALLYSLGGIISALVYNLIARYLGGVQVVLD